MQTETEKIIEQTAKQAPKEFMRVKRKRNLLGFAIILVFVAEPLLHDYLEPSFSICGFVMLLFFIIVVLSMWLKESWKCPICYEMPGFILSNPKYCSECGTKLEE